MKYTARAGSRYAMQTATDANAWSPCTPENRSPTVSGVGQEVYVTQVYSFKLKLRLETPTLLKVQHSKGKTRDLAHTLQALPRQSPAVRYLGFVPCKGLTRFPMAS